MTTQQITDFLLYVSGNKPSTFYNPAEKQAFCNQVQQRAGIIYANEFDAGVKVFGSKKAFEAFITELERNPAKFIDIAEETLNKGESGQLPVNDFLAYFSNIDNLLKEAKDMGLDITQEPDYKKFLSSLKSRGAGVLNAARQTIINYVDSLQAQEVETVLIAPQSPKNFLWLIIIAVVVLIYISK